MFSFYIVGGCFSWLLFVSSFPGHDCSIRLWNLDSKTCVQEITSHRKKFDESIHDVAFHPQKPYIASAGADALAKVFVWRKRPVDQPREGGECYLQGCHHVSTHQPAAQFRPQYFWHGLECGHLNMDWKDGHLDMHWNVGTLTWTGIMDRLAWTGM